MRTLAGDKVVPLGFEVGTGEVVAIPVNHLAVTGQTQMAGKTTTLEALVARSGLRAVAFVTKRGEGAFRNGRRLPPYFRERADWQFVAAVLEATLRERLKFERAWIMRASKGARTLADVQRNVREAMKTAKGLSADIYLTLDEYLSIVVPQIEELRTLEHREWPLRIEPGLNVMNLTAFTTEMQALVIRSVLEHVYQKEDGVVTIIPEAWEFLPQRRGSPVLLAAEELIRKGAASRNFVWLDSQDIAAVNKAVLKSVVVWLLGVQREANEVKRAIAHIPTGTPKPRPRDVMELERGQFIACWGGRVVRVYVQPAWMDADNARRVSRGQTKKVMAPDLARGGLAEAAAAVAPTDQALEAWNRAAAAPEEDEMDRQERERYEATIRELRQQAEGAGAAAREAQAEAERSRRMVQDATARAESAKDAVAAVAALRKVLRVPGTAANLDGKADFDAVVAEVIRRMPAGAGPVQVVAPEALRKEYLRREADRILARVRDMAPLERDILLILEPTDKWIGNVALATRLGRSTGGNQWATFTKAVKGLAADGFVETKERAGVHRNLRAKVAADLVHYQASDEEAEAVYQTVLAELAKEAVGA